jgi:hypothetical protein
MDLHGKAFGDLAQIRDERSRGGRRRQKQRAVHATIHDVVPSTRANDGE